MRFINTDSCRLLFDIGKVDIRIKSVALGAGGRHVVAVMEDGNIHVYSVQALSSDYNKVFDVVITTLINLNVLRFISKSQILWNFHICCSEPFYQYRGYISFMQSWNTQMLLTLGCFHMNNNNNTLLTLILFSFTN